MTKDVALLPCPFCGAIDLELRSKPDPSPPSYPDGVWVIECFGCGALGPFCVEHQNAANTWNARGVVEPKVPTASEAERHFRETLQRIASSHGASDHSCSRRDLADQALAAFPENRSPAQK